MTRSYAHSASCTQIQHGRHLQLIACVSNNALSLVRVTTGARGCLECEVSLAIVCYYWRPWPPVFDALFRLRSYHSGCLISRRQWLPPQWPPRPVPKPTVHGEQVGVLEPPLRHADQNYRVVAERFHSRKSIAVVRSTLTAGPMSNDGSPSPILRKMPRHRLSTHSVASPRTSRTTVGMPPVEGLALAIASTPPVSWNADQRHCQHPVDAPPNNEKPTELQSTHLPLRGRRLSL